MVFPSTPIRIKLTVLLMVTSSTAVLLVSLLTYFFLGRHYQDVYQRDLVNLAEIIGHNCTAALLFNVPEDAETVLHSVDSRASILSIRLYDKDHKQFASYESKLLGDRRQDLSRRVGFDESRLLRVEQPLTLRDGTIIGSLVLLDDTRDIVITQRQGAYLLALSAVAALIGAFCVAAFVQRRISEPLSSLTSAVQRLAAGDHAAWRDVECQRNDELGTLSAAFINMGHRLEESYRELSGHRQTLEDRVAERTEELKQAMDKLTESQSQLIQSEKMAAIGYLVSGVAHEVNNNINFISCALPSIARETRRLVGDGERLPDLAVARQAGEVIERLLNNAEEGVSRTAKIVSDLRTFAHPSQGQFSQVNIHQELDRVLALIHFEIAGRIEIRREYAPDLPLLSCLRDQMNQVYMNVLRNAVQAIDGPGWIEISTRLVEGTVHVRFRDSGSGIPKKIRTRIFDPFYTTKEVGKGTGLGLAISFGIVKKHNGEILVESSGSNGTALLLVLPLQAESASEAGAAGLDGRGVEGSSLQC